MTPADEEVHWILGSRPAAFTRAGRAAFLAVAERSRRAATSSREPAAAIIWSSTPAPTDSSTAATATPTRSSLVLTVGGEPVLVDPGTATYTMNPAMRDAFRSTRMHNTVVIDGCDHVEPRGPFRWAAAPRASVMSSRIETGVDFVQATHNAYGDAAHVRSIFALHGSGWIVIDHVFGAGERTADGYWHLHPMWRADVRGQHVALYNGDRPGPAIGFTSQVSAMCEGPLALFSQEYGRIEPSCTLRTSERRRAPFVMGTFISALPPGTDAVQIHPVVIEEQLPIPGLAPLSRSPPRSRNCWS